MTRPKRSGAGAKSAHLLDTSTLLWALGAPERLSARAKAEGLGLVTRDGPIGEYPIQTIW
jgi:PIN domain nuclease of toxin-antitoxin system